MQNRYVADVGDFGKFVMLYLPELKYGQVAAKPPNRPHFAGWDNRITAKLYKRIQHHAGLEP